MRRNLIQAVASIALAASLTAVPVQASAASSGSSSKDEYVGSSDVLETIWTGKTQEPVWLARHYGEVTEEEADWCANQTVVRAINPPTCSTRPISKSDVAWANFASFFEKGSSLGVSPAGIVLAIAAALAGGAYTIHEGYIQLPPGIKLPF